MKFKIHYQKQNDWDGPIDMPPIDSNDIDEAEATAMNLQNRGYENIIIVSE